MCGEGVGVAELPSGTVTFLFTDLEGSTSLWQDEPEAMRPALARHDEIVRSAIETHGGRVVKTTGDGAHAAFTTASDAIDAAVAAQLALGAEEWPVPGGLRVRMGVHTGPAELREGDYYGTAVNRAARIMSVAHGGQVVMSHAAQELVRDEAVEVLDLGEHRLKDLGQAERLFQVVHPELVREFPPLRSLDAFTTNLPTLRTSFVGRVAELAAVRDVLVDARLVTLTGTGGVGKTRLAVQVAAEMITEFPDGVWLVELATVADPDAVPDAVAATVGLVTKAGLSTTASIADSLAGRRSLLVLDNCEHVLDAAAELVEAILDRPGSVKVLATSREGLRLADERLWPVPSLSDRDRNDDSIALFVDRARAVAPDFALDAPDTAEAVDEICRRLDGIPLAIELAAARTIAMSAPEVRDRLDDRFRLLSGSRRGLERHQTLRQAVQWSYDLLDDNERALLTHCAVFAGGFDLAAAVAVGGGDTIDEYQVLDGLEALVRKSLVTVDRSSGTTRYAMLETIRQFAEERLADAGALPEVSTSSVRYFASRANEVLTWLGSARERDGFAWVRREFPNLRTAFRTAADQGDLTSAAAITVTAGSIAYYLEIFEPAAWAEELIDAARATDHPQLLALYSVACLCNALGRIEDSVRYADAARVLLDDPRCEPLPSGIANSFVGQCYLHVGRPDAWADFARASIDRDPDACAFVNGNLVMALAFAGRLDEARAHAEGLSEIAEATGSVLALSGALCGYAFAFFDADPPETLAALHRYEHLLRDFDVLSGHAAALVARGEAAHGDPGVALDACERSLVAYAASGDRPAATTPLTVLAALLHRIGNDEPAAVITGAGNTPVIAGYPELVTAIADLRAALGADTFDALAAQGKAMETNAMFRYALDQVDAARDGRPSTSLPDQDPNR
jgi:predicted ATPase/class 3 adenylate cyclase